MIARLYTRRVHFFQTHFEAFIVSFSVVLLLVSMSSHLWKAFIRAEAVITIVL